MPCEPAPVALPSATLDRLGHNPSLLPSGAGHDAMAMASHCPVAMLLVRVQGGISHNPAESARVEDVDAAIRALVGFVGDFAARHVV